MLKCHNGYKKWFNSLTDIEKNDLFLKKSGKNNPMYGKKVYDVWLKKYGLNEARKRDNAFRKKVGSLIKGEKNPRSIHDVFPLEKRKEAVNLYETGKYTHLEISKIYGVSRRLIGDIIKEFKK